MLRLSSLTFIIFLAACAESPEDFLAKRGRPGPYSCIKNTDDTVYCSDGAGVTWVCENRAIGGDNECVIMNMLPRTGER